MYVLKLKGDLVWQTAGPDKSEDPLEFELEALLSKRATPLLVYGEVHRRIKRTLNVEQLDAYTFAKCLEEFAAEIRKAAESYELRVLVRALWCREKCRYCTCFSYFSWPCRFPPGVGPAR